MTLLDHNNALAVIDALIERGSDATQSQVDDFIRNYPKAGDSMWSKSDLLEIIEEFYSGDANYPWLRKLLTKKPIRSLSGITSITVLTKPFPCPGRCVFCPVDVRMPKSYIASEPGAMRASRLGFDPYQQVTARLQSYSGSGHPISKIELIVLGGSWSAYDREYQIWFIKRLFDALNDFGIRKDKESHAYPINVDDRINPGETYNAHINASQYIQDPYTESATLAELEVAQKINESGSSRCVGLSLETRPDLIDREECVKLRELGATKIQIGIQSLDDNVLYMNKRGHTVGKTKTAMALLRQFGFKIHAHWMPNLYGSTPAADITDYQRVFDMESIRPDELKIYPTVLIENTELEQIAAEGLWNAYSEEDLNKVLSFVLTHTPEYCRLTRIIRDIPGFEILAGNKKGNLRQIVEQLVEPDQMHDMRAREIKNETIPVDELVLDEITYDTSTTQEHFLQFIRPRDRKIAGFLRLSLPKSRSANDAPVDELKNAAIIREVHVYGQSLDLGRQDGVAQHQGLGRLLMAEADNIAKANDFKKIAVISSVGTRPYYDKLGFIREGLYQTKLLAEN